jgi:hypothetical protein
MLILYDCHQLVMCIFVLLGPGLLWHWIQLLEGLPYYNEFHIR